MKVINQLGGPGLGKSTIMAGVFAHAKRAGFRIEMSPEYAKAMTYKKRHSILKDQLYILAKQQQELDAYLRSDEVDYVIMDTSLLMGMVYATPDYFQYFRAIVLEAYQKYDNINLNIVRPNLPSWYKQEGRTQNFTEACALDDDIYGLTKGLSVKTHYIDPRWAFDRIWSEIMIAEREQEMGK